MEQLIRKIFVESGFVLNEQNLPFYSKEEKSFFFKLSFEESDFVTLKNKEIIKQNVKYKSLIDSFKNIVNSGENVIIEKNSSLLIFVKCSSIKALENHRQQILMLEEDEYFLKKYVIFYTEQSISNLLQEPVLDTLTAKLNNSDNLNYFASNGYEDVISEYITILQLFIKLPFLSLSIDQSEYVPLNQKIINELGNLNEFHDKILNEESLFQEIDFFNIEHESKIEDLINFLPND